ncbi:MAG: permease-like cell division protein FtsX [Gammaproteobacteria bacterium]
MNRLQHYLYLHKQNCIGAMHTLLQQRIATLLTVTVIGIALALPAGLNILVTSGQAVSGGWEGIRDFSVYMKTGTSVEESETLADELRRNDLIAAVELITADKALKQFRSDSSFGLAVEDLSINPLPHTLVVRPTEVASADQLANMEKSLQATDSVEVVKIDTEWVARLNAIIDFVRRGVWFAAILLAGAVIIIVGNTIRLEIQNRHDEIEVQKLLGASNGFVRRPFLYIGLCYGLAGSLAALLILGLGMAMLAGPLDRLAALYDSEFSLPGLDFVTFLAVLCGGLVAGWAGAWSAVTRHLGTIEPR